MIRLNLLYPVKPVFEQTSTETEKSFHTLWLCTITENIFRKKNTLTERTAMNIALFTCLLVLFSEVSTVVLFKSDVKKIHTPKLK